MRSPQAPLFFLLLDATAHHDESGMGEQSQGHVAVPSPPGSHLILVESNLALGLFKALFNLPATPCHGYQFR